MARNLNQGETNVTTYFTTLSKLWQELDLDDDFRWNYTKHSKHFRAQIIKERSYDFLPGLNRDLDEVRGSMLGIKSLPSIEEIFTEAYCKEVGLCLAHLKHPSYLLMLVIHARMAIFEATIANDQIITMRSIGSCMVNYPTEPN